MAFDPISLAERHAEVREKRLRLGVRHRSCFAARVEQVLRHEDDEDPINISIRMMMKAMMTVTTMAKAMAIVASVFMVNVEHQVVVITHYRIGTHLNRKHLGQGFHFIDNPLFAMVVVDTRNSIVTA